VGAQQLHHRPGEPTVVTELKRVPQRARQCLERLGEPLVVALEGRRQLPQQRPELARGNQRLDPRQQQIEMPRRLAQPLDVRHVATRLDRKREALWRFLRPSLDRLALRQAVKRRPGPDGRGRR
jgi:hypothetical protein